MSTSHLTAAGDIPSPSASSFILDADGLVSEDKMPQLKIGEVRELGCTLHPMVVEHILQPARRAWRESESPWLLTNQIVLQKQTMGDLGSRGIQKNEVIKAIASFIDLPMQKPGKDKALRKALMKELPTKVPVSSDVKEGRVADDDPRQGLRGKRSLVAARKLKRVTILGVYRGYVLMKKEFDQLIESPPCCWMPSADESWEMRVESYCWADLKDYSGHLDKSELYNSGVGWGNLCSLVNDGKILDGFFSPMHPWEEKNVYEDSESVSPANCIMFPCHIRGFPHIFLMTISEIAPGDELLYSYGYDYWSHVKEISRKQRKANPSSSLSLVNSDSVRAQQGQEPESLFQSNSQEDEQDPSYVFQETYEKLGKGAVKADPPKRKVLDEDRDPWDDDDDDDEDLLDEDEKDLCLYLLPGEKIENEKEEGEIESSQEHDRPRPTGIAPDIKETLQMRRHRLQLERLVVTYMAERQMKESQKWRRSKGDLVYVNPQCCAVTASVLMKEIRGFTSHKISPSQFLESRPNLFAPLVSRSVNSQGYVLKNGPVSAAQEVIRSQRTAFDHRLEQLKVNIVNYMDIKSRPRVYYSELNPQGSEGIFDAYSRAWYNLFQPIMKHRTPPWQGSGQPLVSQSVEGSSSSRPPLKRPFMDDGNASENNNASFVDLYLVGKDFKMNYYPPGSDLLLELDPNLAQRLRSQKKTSYDPAICKIYQNCGRCPGGKQCQKIHLVDERRAGDGGTGHGSQIDQADSSCYRSR